MKMNSNGLLLTVDSNLKKKNKKTSTVTSEIDRTRTVYKHVPTANKTQAVGLRANNTLSVTAAVTAPRYTCSYSRRGASVCSNQSSHQKIGAGFEEFIF